MQILEGLKRKSILFSWWQWHFSFMPKRLLEIWKNFLKFGLYYFSVPLLLTTFFSHFHRYKWEYPTRGFDLGKILETAFSNLISRIMGMIFRFPLIIVGTLFEIFLIFTGVLVIIFWIFLPLFLILAFFYGFSLLF